MKIALCFVGLTGSVDFGYGLGKPIDPRIAHHHHKKYIIDGDFKYNTARLINHSCNPNCEVSGTGLKVWVYAIRDIKKGEELTYDYGFGFDEYYKDFPCRCRSKNCVGYIVRSESRWRIKKQKSI